MGRVLAAMNEAEDPILPQHCNPVLELLLIQKVEAGG